MTLGLRLAAKDDTQGALRSAQSGYSRFKSLVTRPIVVPLRVARAGLGLARDIHLGLAPLISGIDRVLERGGALEVQQKAFNSLTGRNGRQSLQLARRLQDASSGMLGFGESMALANRALSSGMGIDQLAVAIEFVGKKAVATGKDARQALDTVITGLIRGSTLFLDDYGILVDGLDGVKRTYDAIHGSGAFENLGPAAQKAETVRQAITEMRGQMDKLNISGRETIFLYSGIKTAIGDATDKLVLAAAKSESVKGALEGVRNILRGITEHFENNGSIEDVLFGKGKSGGLLGVLKGLALDFGEMLGRGMLGGILKAIGASRSIVMALFTERKSIESSTTGQSLIKFFGGGIGTKLFGGGDYDPAATAPDVSKFRGTGEQDSLAESLLQGWYNLGELAARANSVGLLALFGLRTASPMGVKHPVGEVLDNTEKAGVGGNLEGAGITARYLIESITKGREEARRLLRERRKKFRADYGLGLGVGFGLGDLGEVDAFDFASQLGDSILGGGEVFGRTRSATNRLLAEFAPEKTDILGSAGVDPADYALTPVARRSAQRRLSVLRQKLGNINRGGGGARQAALKRTGEVVAKLRREGKSISPGDRRSIFSQLLDQETNSRGESLRAGIGEIEQGLSADDEARRVRREGLDVARNGTPSNFMRTLAGDLATAVSDAMKPSNDKSVTVVEAVQLLAGQVGRLVAAFGGAENEMSKIAGKA